MTISHVLRKRFGDDIKDGRDARSTTPFDQEYGLPFNISIILPSISKLSTELDTGKHAALATNVANELDSPVHVPRDIHGIPNLNVPSIPANRPARRRPWSRLPCGQGVQRGLARHGGAGAVQVW